MKLSEVLLNWVAVRPMLYVSAFVPFASAVPVKLKSSTVYFESLIVTSYSDTDCSDPLYVFVSLWPLIVTTTSASSAVIVNFPGVVVML